MAGVQSSLAGQWPLEAWASLHTAFLILARGGRESSFGFLFIYFQTTSKQTYQFKMFFVVLIHLCQEARVTSRWDWPLAPPSGHGREWDSIKASQPALSLKNHPDLNCPLYLLSVSPPPPILRSIFSYLAFLSKPNQMLC